MKKYLSVLPAILFAFSLTACAGTAGGTGGAPAMSAAPTVSQESTQTPSAPEESYVPAAEEVRGVTIPAFSIQVNGIGITQESVAAYPMYSVQAKSTNSSGTETTVTYVGFSIKDILKAAGLNENYVWLEATASDDYTVTLKGGVIYEDTTLLAVTRDGSPFTTSPWLAPCSDKVTGDYLKGMVSILVNTTEGAPDIKTSDTVAAGTGAAGTGSAPNGSLPDILDRTDKVTFGPYSFLVNGKEVTNDTLAGLKIYKITASTTNKNGDVSQSEYTGYKLADVLAACGLKDPAKVKVTANDGYETDLTGELITSDYTLAAIEKDKEVGEDGTIWIAPCSETSSSEYCKLVVGITAE